MNLLRLLVLALVMTTCSAGCDAAESWLTGEPMYVAPTATTTPLLKAPISRMSKSDPIVTENRVYLEERLENITLRYEPWVNYQVIQTIKDAIGKTLEILPQTLGIEETAPIVVFATFENVFNQSAADNQFQHPAWLAGFASFSHDEGKAINARVYINVQAPRVPHSTAHEIAHVATPGLPLWLAEGVAELIATRVYQSFDPKYVNLRELQARGKIRRTAIDGSLPNLHELSTFPWDTSNDPLLLDIAYAESWQFVEYLFLHANPTLEWVISKYSREVPETVSYFEDITELSAASLWLNFKAEIINKLNDQEKIGENLCGLLDVRTKGDVITQEWNEFLKTANTQEPNDYTKQFQYFEREWSRLYMESVDLIATGSAKPILNLFLSYFNSMQQAMNLLSIQEPISGNQSVRQANDLLTQADLELKEALQTRKQWLQCQQAV